MAEISERAMIAEVVQRLIGKYPHLAPDDIVRVVRMVHAGFDQSSIRDFVPLLVERKARAELAKGGPALAAN